MFQDLWDGSGHVEQHGLSAIFGNQAELVDQHQCIGQLLLKVVSREMVSQPPHDLQERGKVLQHSVDLLTVSALRDS